MLVCLGARVRFAGLHSNNNRLVQSVLRRQNKVCSIPVSRALARRMSFNATINRCQNIIRSFSEAVKYCLDAINKKQTKKLWKREMVSRMRREASCASCLFTGPVREQDRSACVWCALSSLLKEKKKETDRVKPTKRLWQHISSDFWVVTSPTCRKQAAFLLFFLNIQSCRSAQTVTCNHCVPWKNSTYLLSKSTNTKAFKIKAYNLLIKNITIHLWFKWLKKTFGGYFLEYESSLWSTYNCKWQMAMCKVCIDRSWSPSLWYSDTGGRWWAGELDDLMEVTLWLEGLLLAWCWGRWEITGESSYGGFPFLFSL